MGGSRDTGNARGTSHQPSATLSAYDARLLAERLVYRGYVDDPRNTDHSWMETCAFHFHCEGLVAQLQLSAGDDAAHAFWMDVGDANATYAGMMANHKVWVDEVAASMRQK